MVRLAVFEDLPRIAEMQVFGWRNAYRGIVSDNFLFKELSVSKRVAKYEREWGTVEAKFYVNDDNGIVNGFMNIGKCRDSDKIESFELCAIYVEPLMMNQGIGKQLIEKCESIAIESGYSENVLWVFKENTKSRGFYERMGYRVEGKEQVLDKFNAIEIRYHKVIR